MNDDVLVYVDYMDWHFQYHVEPLTTSRARDLYWLLSKYPEMRVTIDDKSYYVISKAEAERHPPR